MERRGPAIEPKEIKQEDDFTVSIVWGDEGSRTLFRGRRLLDHDNHLELVSGSAVVPLDRTECARTDL